MSFNTFLSRYRNYIDSKHAMELLSPYLIQQSKGEEIGKLLSRIKKELTENQITLTDFFNQ